MTERKNTELHLLVLRERKNIFPARQISARHGPGFHTLQIIVHFNDHR